MKSSRVWLEGHGSRLVPYERAEVARLPDGHRVVFCHHGEQNRQVMVAPQGDGLGLALGPGTTAASDVLAFIEPISHEQRWRLVTRHFTAAWPVGWIIFDTPYDASWPFELVHRQAQGEAMIYAQGPWPERDAPTLDALVGEGMQQLGRAELPMTGPRSGQWLGLSYVHDGIPWGQHRLLVTLDQSRILVTAQAPAPLSDQASSAAQEVADSLVLRTELP